MQSIAITIGTSNCDAPTPLKVGQAQAFVEANKVALANDIARGNGETIVGLSKVYGCSNAENFGKDLKSKYSGIFTSSHSESAEITKRITAVAAESCGITI
jgi:acetyl-CoA carboxylase carboxyltransferase component